MKPNPTTSFYKFDSSFSCFLFNFFSSIIVVIYLYESTNGMELFQFWDLQINRIFFKWTNSKKISSYLEFCPYLLPLSSTCIIFWLNDSIIDWGKFHMDQRLILCHTEHVASPKFNVVWNFSSTEIRIRGHQDISGKNKRSILTTRPRFG